MMRPGSKRARLYYVERLELDPACATAHAALGEIALNAGDEAGAKRCYKDAKASDPHASSVRRHGDLLKRRKM